MANRSVLNLTVLALLASVARLLLCRFFYIDGFKINYRIAKIAAKFFVLYSYNHMYILYVSSMWLYRIVGIYNLRSTILLVVLFLWLNFLRSLVTCDLWPQLSRNAQYESTMHLTFYHDRVGAFTIQI